MRLLVLAAGQAPTGSGPRPLPVAFSLVVHGAVLALVVLGPLPQRERPKSLYEQVIAPNERKIVWYDFRKQLPAVTSRETDSHPIENAEVRMPQSIVANPPDAPSGKRLVWRPAPQIKPQLETPSPNLLSFRMPRILPPPPGPPRRLFTPPPAVKKAVQPAPELPAPPPIMAKTPKIEPLVFAAAKVSRPKPKEFVAPKAAPPQVAKAPTALPEAPAIASTLRSERTPLLAENVAGALANKPKPKNFVPPSAPAAQPVAPAQANLPDAPAVRAASNSAGGAVTGVADASLAAALANKPKPKSFVAPSGANGKPGGAPGGDASAPALDDAPSLNAAAAYGNVDIAVVGLNPSGKMGALPDANAARFSAGPNANGLVGGTGSTEGTRLSVPGLTIRNGQGSAGRPLLLAKLAPTSTENVMAAVRSLSPSPGSSENPLDAPGAIRLTQAPDPRFNGREVYTMAVQMPNITSYEGSWILWFAEHEPSTRQNRGLRPPMPLHKVDPKYIPAAIDERVEGKVRLSGVIRADGRVEEVQLLHGVDDRLDRSATEALLKWEFSPAERDGKPMPVDVVVEIPFRLAPRLSRR